MATENNTQAEDSAETTEEVMEIHMLPPIKKVEVGSVSKLISGLTGHLEIGFIYDFTYQHATVATADSTREGRIAITVIPSKWAVKVAEGLWEYELDETVAIDPTTVDVLTEGWCAVLITDAKAEVVADEEEDSPSEVHPVEPEEDSE